MVRGVGNVLEACWTAPASLYDNPTSSCQMTRKQKASQLGHFAPRVAPKRAYRKSSIGLIGKLRKNYTNQGKLGKHQGKTSGKLGRTTKHIRKQYYIASPGPGRRQYSQPGVRPPYRQMQLFKRRRTSVLWASRS